MGARGLRAVEDFARARWPARWIIRQRRLFSIEMGAACVLVVEGDVLDALARLAWPPSP